MKTGAKLLIYGTLLVWLPGCRHTERQAALPSRVTLQRASTELAAPPAPLPIDPDPRPELVIASLNKRVLGRQNSQRDIYRVAHDVDPLVTEAVKLPDVQADLKTLADSMGLPLLKMRSNWIAMQDADIMLESGGDPDAVSSAGAVGAAQWMPGPAANNGLHVNRAAAEQITPQITELQRQLAWIEFLRDPSHDPKAVGIPIVSPSEIEPKFKLLLTQIETLRARRSALDERYDARKSIFAQTRYLLHLTSRFPTPSWIFQAYHGGEAGAEKTLHEYCGSSWPGTAAAAIRTGRPGTVRGLTFEAVYFGSTPKNHTDAFRYLYGRGDDHRHYWWKLRVAQEGLDLYNRNTAESNRACKALYPGCAAPTVWYGKDHPPLVSLDELMVRTTRHDLRPVPAAPDLTIDPTIDDTLRATQYQVLQPSAMGALNIIRDAYQKCGGRAPLEITELSRTVALNVNRTKRKAAGVPAQLSVQSGKPLWPPKEDQTEPFDFHTLGLEFDIRRPKDPMDRMTLDYCIGYLEDREIVMRTESVADNSWQIVPNPRYAKPLVDAANTGQLPHFRGM